MEPYRIAETANARLQNRINISIVFNYLREHGSSYRAEMVRALGLSAPAVSRAVEQLMADGYVVESGSLLTSGGKTVAEVAANAERGLVVGVDLLKGASKFGVFDFAGRPRLIRRGPDLGSMLRSERDGAAETLAEHVIASLQEVLADAETEAVPNQAPPLAAVCIGLPAAVNPATGQVTNVPLYPQLRELSIKQRIASHFAVPCIVENDIKLAAFAENRLGSGKQFRNLLYLDINNGVGAGIILDNRLVRGSLGCAGEIGYARTAANADAPSLEETASLAAICRIAGLPDPAQVFAAAAGGGAAAAAAIEQSVAHVATTLLTTILVVNPELVVIGGDILEMPEVGVLYVDPLRDRIRQHAPFTPPLIEPSALGAEACVRGAALYAVESLLLAKYPFAAGVPDSVMPAQIQHI